MLLHYTLICMHKSSILNSREYTAEQGEKPLAAVEQLKRERMGAPLLNSAFMLPLKSLKN